MPNEERVKTENKARRWFSEYLRQVTEDTSSEQFRKQVMDASRTVFRKSLRNNEKLFSEIEEFVSEKRTASEKKDFFDSVMRRLKKKIREEYLRKYPH